MDSDDSYTTPKKMVKRSKFMLWVFYHHFLKKADNFCFPSSTFNFEHKWSFLLALLFFLQFQLRAGSRMAWGLDEGPGQSLWHQSQNGWNLAGPGSLTYERAEWAGRGEMSEFPQTTPTANFSNEFPQIIPIANLSEIGQDQKNVALTGWHLKTKCHALGHRSFNIRSRAEMGLQPAH